MRRDRLEDAQRWRLLKLARARRPKALWDLSQRPGSATNYLNLGRLSRRSAQVIKPYWWVPAGFAVLFLLRTILGG